MCDKNKKQLAVVPGYEGLRMAMAPAEALMRVKELRAFVKEVMQPGVDYGVIPGMKKPCLYQPGAQMLCEIYGMSFSFKDIDLINDWEKPLFIFRKRCVLRNRRDRSFICDGIGSCNSKEDRYAWRWVGEWDVPKGIDKTTLRSKTREGKRGEYTQYRMPNEDVFSLVNTIEKMACKRSLVHATLNATRSAGIFNQDLEDLAAAAIALPETALGLADEHRSWEPEDDPSAKLTEFSSRIAGATSLLILNRIAAEVKKHKFEGAAVDQLSQKWTQKKAELIEKSKEVSHAANG